MARSPILQIANAAQVTLFFGVAGTLVENVFGASHTGGVVFDQSLADALGASIKAAFTNNLAAHMSNNTSLVRVGVRSLSSPNLPMFRDTGAAVLGSAVGDALPSQIAQCITLRTARSGKSYRGRTFLSGWCETVNDTNGRQTPTASTAGVAFVTAVQAALTARNLTLAVLSRPAYEVIVTEETIIPNGTNITRVLSHQTPKFGSFQNVIATESRNLNWENQRRRNNGRGIPPTLLDAVAGARFDLV